MEIKPKEITVGEVYENYQDNKDAGVTGYGGKLDIRPPYQRAYVYDGKQRGEVIHSIRKQYPLNVIYWAIRDDGNYEVLDGQQRTISFCEYLNNDFSIEINGNPYYFENLSPDEQQEILDYKLQIYFCRGTDKEKLDWFRIVNIAGVKLTEQELRNAVYTGPWLTDAKLKFSKKNGPAHRIAGKYLKGKPIHQDYLETALKWINQGKIADYMSQHQKDPNANELWYYFGRVIEWVKNTFTNYRSEMKGINWGKLYDNYGAERFDTAKLEARISKLMEDDDVTNRPGIYDYVLTGSERSLSIRQFTKRQRGVAYERQKGICAICEKHFAFEKMEADHITPWSKGGETTTENCQMLCKEDNKYKSDR